MICYCFRAFHVSRLSRAMCASVNSSGPDQVDISECGNLTEEYAMVSRQSRIYAMVILWSYGQEFIYAMVSI